MSNDPYQQRHFFEEDPFSSLCVQRDENGDCLMSIKMVIMDFSKLFCEQVKDKKNDKAIRPAGR
ncbi:MAG: hypothetical protein E6R13_09100 [Spirochaetes bacterium]|nr:MAG: hypothetical protein E6R13_09100 [Spirochaetota bacterium]